MRVLRMGGAVGLDAVHKFCLPPKREDKMKIVEEEGKKSEIWEVQRREVQRKGGPAEGLGFGVWGSGFQVFGDKNRNRTKRK